MKFTHRVKDAWNALRGKKHKGPGYDFTKWFLPSNIFAGRTSNTLATNETIFAAVGILANGMAVLPLKLHKDHSVVHNHISDLIMNEPNHNMTSFDFIRTLETARNTYGNAYALKMYDEYFQVESLLPLDPSRVEPVVEETSSELWYEIDGDKGTYYVHNLDMIHVKHISAIGQSIVYKAIGYKGISPIDVLRNTIDYDTKVRKFSLEQMNNVFLASFILKMDTNVSTEKKADILDNFRQFYKENGGVILQEKGFEVEPLNRSIIDTKVFEVERITRSRVAMVFNIPVHMLGEVDGQSYSSMEQMSLEFVQWSLGPIIRQYEQEFNRKLLTKEERAQGMAFKFNEKALLRGDTSTQSDFYFKGIRSGWFTPNEVRAYEELPPLEGGDKLYMSRDLSPIDERGEGGDM